ncbi:MAG TPA: hypothetical protein PLI70_09815 [Gemmatimonadales bacterium]|nr:hypothetical protein [Gemmatimonadales bacterium]
MGFYLVEAAVLSLALIGGLMLAGSAARRYGVTFPALTSHRMIAIVLGLVAVSAALGELAGPHVILHYYAAATILAAGAGAWSLSKAATALAARPKAP